jgi:hypothetical protein
MTSWFSLSQSNWRDLDGSGLVVGGAIALARGFHVRP